MAWLDLAEGILSEFAETAHRAQDRGRNTLKGSAFSEYALIQACKERERERQRNPNVRYRRYLRDQLPENKSRDANRYLAKYRSDPAFREAERVRKAAYKAKRRALKAAK